MNNKILCIGDIILDTYSHGDVRRISPEAPIPVLKINNNKYEVLGGSGNVARNICSSGSNCHLIAICGKDEEAKILKKLLRDSKKLSFNLIEDGSRCTTKKNRFVSDNQQILRVDREETQAIGKKVELKVFDSFKNKIDQFGIVVISDYSKGMLTDSLLKSIIQISKKKKKIIIVDPKKEDFSAYRGASIITPNYKELLKASQYKVNTGKEINKEKASEIVSRLSKKIIKKFNFNAVVTTRSSDGISIFDQKNKSLHLPSKAKEVYDVSGAGDTVIAYISSGLAKGRSLFNSVEIANDAAGVAVGKFGTTVVKVEDLLANKSANKLLSLNEVCADLKNKINKKIGFTNGCFDLIHQGHIFYLKEARKECDFLILGLNSDSSIKRIKGNDRPILNQEERTEVLKNFNFIDCIVIFNEDTPIKLIKKIKPNLIFKGDDYKRNEVVGFKEIQAWGGKVKLIKCIKGKSTSGIIRKIKNVT